MERDRVSGVSCKNIFNFNSHAHVERDLQSDTFHNDLVISTHTLTWSVTDQNWNGHNFVAKISTHTLTWSVTSVDCVIVLRPTNFNSHAHVERD